MSLPTQPDLAELSSRLAADNARVAKYADQLPGRVDQILEALQSEDWPEIRRLSEYLSEASKAYGYETLHQRAQRVCDEMDGESNQTEVRRRIVRLIGACGSARP